MKKKIKQIAAALCAGVMLTALTLTSAGAEEADKKTALPSGITADAVGRELKDKAAELSGGDPAFASAAVGIFQGDTVLYSGYFGKTDMENNIPADESSVYEWGSISKTLIWVSAMQLWEQGRLDLDRDVREYLPEGFFRHLSYDEPITMMNLMNHNAGWQETTRPIWETDENAILPLGEELQAIEPAQIHRPGEVVAYSNYGAAVAGYVIECVSGMDYCEYVHKNIFEPLGMEHTALNPTHSDNEWVYARRNEMKIYTVSLGYVIDLGNYLNYVPAYPAGAATGTLADLMTYAQALVKDDSPLFQKPETQAMMFTGTDFYGESDIPLCAHGFWCMEYAVRTYGHSGATMAGQANMLFDLETKTGLVVMVNEPNGNAFLYDTPELVFGRLSPEKYVSGAAEKLSLSGYYLSARSTYRGMLKFMPYLTAVPASRVQDAVGIGRGVYQLSDPEGTVLIGEKTYPDGGTALQQPSADMLHDSFYLVKLCLLTVYILLAVAAVYLLRIGLKLKKHGKRTALNSSAVMTAGQISRIVSVIALLVLVVVYASYGGGIPFAAGAAFGIAQMLCAAVCGVSAAMSLVSVVSHKNEKALTIRYVMNTIGCVLPIAAILFFEMYRFWGC